jgi:hypothetical protein
VHICLLHKVELGVAVLQPFTASFTTTPILNHAHRGRRTNMQLIIQGSQTGR